MLKTVTSLLAGGMTSVALAVVDLTPTLRDSPCGKADKQTEVCLSAVNPTGNHRSNLYVVVYDLDKKGKVEKATHTRVELDGGPRMLPTEPVVLEENESKTAEEIIQPARTSMRRYTDYIGYKVYKVRGKEKYQELESLRLSIDWLAKDGPTGTLYKYGKSGEQIVGNKDFKMEHRAFPAALE